MGYTLWPAGLSNFKFCYIILIFVLNGLRTVMLVTCFKLIIRNSTHVHVNK